MGIVAESKKVYLPPINNYFSPLCKLNWSLPPWHEINKRKWTKWIQFLTLCREKCQCLPTFKTEGNKSHKFWLFCSWILVLEKICRLIGNLCFTDPIHEGDSHLHHLNNLWLGRTTAVCILLSLPNLFAHQHCLYLSCSHLFPVLLQLDINLVPVWIKSVKNQTFGRKELN